MQSGSVIAANGPTTLFLLTFLLIGTTVVHADKKRDLFQRNGKLASCDVFNPFKVGSTF